MKRFFIGVSCLVLISFLTSPLWGQATAQINGTVKDQSGAVLPGVEITATQTETGIARSTITNETGSYVLPNLPIGPYRFEASLPGFRTFVQSGIMLQVNANPTINPVLEIGQISEAIEVQANAAMVETRSVGVGQVVENERILELPLNGRNVADLVTLSGAAVQLGTTSNRSFQGNPVLATAGGLGFGTGYYLDGVAHVSPYDGQADPLPFPDALQEFKLETSGLAAQNNRAAAVNAVTKSGTNEFHGDLFEFVRNDLFNARNYFAQKGSTLKRHQFGGTLGGPIVRNKLLFMTGYQRTTVRQDPADLLAYVPTPAMMAGDFTAIASPACNSGRQINLAAPFVNNRINPSSFSPAAVKISGFLPKTDNPCGELRFGRLSRQDDYQFIGRADYQASNNNSMFFRYLLTHSGIAHPYRLDSTNILNTNAAGFDNYAQAYTLGDTMLFGPNVVNAFRLSVNRTNIQRLGSEFFEARDVGINIYSAVPKFMILSVTGGFSIGGGSQSDSTFRGNFYQMADDVNINWGNHQIAFGGTLALARHNGYAHLLSPGNFSFNGQVTGLGLGDYLLGRTSQFQHRNPNPLHTEQWFTGGYLQDTWKAMSNLTLNYGVRWQPHLPQALTDARVYLFDYEKFKQGVKSTVFLNAPAGLSYFGDPGFPGEFKNYRAKWGSFGPRLGLAWDPMGDGRTSVRASVGVSFEDVTMQMRLSTPGSPPWGDTIRLPFPTGGLDNPYLDYPGGEPFPGPLTGFRSKNANAPFILLGDYISPPDKFDPITTTSWNLSVQRQVMTDMLVSVSYLGNKTTHWWAGKALNPAIYFPGNFDANRRCAAEGFVLTGGNPGTACSTVANTNSRRRLVLERPQDGGHFANVNLYDTGGSQTYNGMIASIQRRTSGGLTFSGNYTWSKCLGDERRQNTGTGFDATESYLDPNDRRRDRGLCSADRRHILNLTSVVETPQFANPTVRMIATGWRLAGIFRKNSGNRLNILGGIDRSLNGIRDQRPNQILENVYGDKSSLTNYLNPAAFAQPALGTLGSLGYNAVEGPGFWQLDAALSRIFQVRENQRLEFRAEAYNLTNSLRTGDPGTNLNTVNTFGRIDSALDPRILQFALKYVF